MMVMITNKKLLMTLDNTPDHKNNFELFKFWNYVENFLVGHFRQTMIYSS